MSAQPKANEPSMEEILASIRKIIADDQSKTPASPAPVQAAPAPAPVPAPQPVAVAPVPAPSPPPDDDILDLGSEAMPLEAMKKDDIDLLFEQGLPQSGGAAAEAAFKPQNDQVPEMMMSSSRSDLDMSSLLSHQASSSISSAFGSLAHTVLSQNARTVDDLVKEMLKPLLKGWLDDNLPALVERLVRAEIERVARGGRG